MVPHLCYSCTVKIPSNNLGTKTLCWTSDVERFVKVKSLPWFWQTGWGLCMFSVAVRIYVYKNEKHETSTALVQISDMKLLKAMRMIPPGSGLYLHTSGRKLSSFCSLSTQSLFPGFTRCVNLEPHERCQRCTSMGVGVASTCQTDSTNSPKPVLM